MTSIAAACVIALAFGYPSLCVAAAEEASSPESPQVEHPSIRADSDSRAVHPDQDARDVHAEPRFFSREFANSAVVVLRIRIPPHASVPQHDVSPRVVVWLTDAHLRLTFPDGTSREETHRAGQTSWVTPERHAGYNLSDQPVEFIVVIPTTPHGAEDRRIRL